MMLDTRSNNLSLWVLLKKPLLLDVTGLRWSYVAATSQDYLLDHFQIIEYTTSEYINIEPRCIRTEILLQSCCEFAASGSFPHH